LAISSHVSEVTSVLRLAYVAVLFVTIAACGSIQRRAALEAAADSYNAKVTALNIKLDALGAEAQALQRDSAFPKLGRRFAEAAGRRVTTPLTARAATDDFRAAAAAMTPEERALADKFAALAQRAAALNRRWKALDRERAREERVEAALVARGEPRGLLIPSPPILCRLGFFGQFPTLACG